MLREAILLRWLKCRLNHNREDPSPERDAKYLEADRIFAEEMNEAERLVASFTDAAAVIHQVESYSEQGRLDNVNYQGHLVPLHFDSATWYPVYQELHDALSSSSTSANDASEEAQPHRHSA